MAETKVVNAPDPRNLIEEAYEAFNEDGRLSEDAEDAVQRFAFAAIGKFCKLLGHVARRDHCGKPEHDYCIACREVIPGSAH